MLAGDGPLRADAERAAQRLGGRLRVLGHVSQQELARYLAASDATLFPTLRDCWGMVVNESLAAGVPVLGSRYAGACEELLKDGVGRIFDPLDPADFDAALRAVVVADCFRDCRVPELRAAVAGHDCEDAARAMLQAIRMTCARHGEGRR